MATTPTTQNSWYTPSVAARLATVNIRTMYRWLENGSVQGIKMGGRWRVAVAPLDRMIAGGLDEEEQIEGRETP